MRSSNFVGVMLWGGMAGLCPSIALAAQIWKPVLTQPADKREYREPLETFRFPIPAKLSVEYLQQITLEVDDIDVTALIQRDANDAIFTPAEPLAFGAHTMRIVHYAQDGNIEELANWSFEVRQSSLYRQAVLQGNVNLNGNYLLDSKNIIPKPKQASVDGSTNLAAAVADGNWQVNGNAALMGNSNYQALGMKRSVDLSSFLFTGQSGNVVVNAGHHTIASNSLALDMLTNRGVSTTLSSDSHYYGATAFAMRATPVMGFTHGLGISDAENRIEGVTVAAFPFEDHPEQQYLSLVYLHGKSSTGITTAAGVPGGATGVTGFPGATGVTGVAIIGDPSVKEGNAWGVISESSFLEKQARLRLEYAGATLTTTDEFATTPIPQLKDNAYAMLAEYRPQADPSDANPTMWKIGLLNQYVGRDFSSIANEGLPRDKQLWRLSGEVYKGSLFATAGLSTEIDNVKAETDIPQIRTNRADVALNYAPQLEFSNEGTPIYGSLGQQNYSLTLSKAQGKNATFPTSAVVARTDNNTVSINAVGSFNYATWNWMIMHGIGTLTDNTGLQPDSDTVSSGLGGMWRIGEGFTIAPRWQLNSSKYAGITNDMQMLSLDALQLLLDGRLALRLSYTQTDMHDSAGALHTVSTNYIPAVEWQVVTGSQNKPGASLRLSGMFSDTQDRITPANSRDTYQIMLTAIIGLQFGF